MRKDLTGIPSIVEDESTETGAAKLEASVTPQPLSTSVSALIRDVLDKHDDNTVIVLDMNSRTLTAASGLAGAALKVAAVNASEVEGNIQPDADQSGRSLTWSADAVAGVSQEVSDAVDALINAAKPKRTVESLVAALVGSDLPENCPVIVINQADAVVHILKDDTGHSIQDAVDALANAGDRVQITLSEPAGGGSAAAPKVFEGGTIG